MGRDNKHKFQINEKEDNVYIASDYQLHYLNKQFDFVTTCNSNIARKYLVNHGQEFKTLCKCHGNKYFSSRCGFY